MLTSYAVAEGFVLFVCSSLQGLGFLLARSRKNSASPTPSDENQIITSPPVTGLQPIEPDLESWKGYRAGGWTLGSRSAARS